jgi:hypothetical protein
MIDHQPNAEYDEQRVVPSPQTFSRRRLALGDRYNE